MGLKLLVNLHFNNPPINRGKQFTKVNGNKQFFYSYIGHIYDFIA